MTNKIILAYQKATNDLAIAFIKKYYGNEYVKDMFWVADEIGTILCINDDFWGVERMKQALEFNASEEQLFEFYHYEIELPEGENIIINFKNYLKLGTVWKNKKKYKKKEKSKIPVLSYHQRI